MRSTSGTPAAGGRNRPWGGLGLVLLSTLVALVPRPSAASPPPTVALSPRELLALSPQALGELADPARVKARERLARALVEQAAAGLRPLLLPLESRLPPAVQLPLTADLQKVLALDLQRRAQKEEPVLVAALLGTALKPLAAPGLLDPVAPPGERSARLLLPAGLTPPVAAALRGLCERASREWPTLLTGATVRLLAGVPFAVVLSQRERVVYVNPVLLALLAAPTPADAQAAALPLDPERELTYRSVADCAQKVQARCQGCTRGDAAECAAVQGTLAGVACSDVAADLAKLSDLCLARALALRSVADCVRQRDPACAAAPPTPRCREIVDRCIAAPTSPSGSSGDREPAGGLCLECGACSTCNQGCANGCGELGRQACSPLGEPCSDKVGQSCTESWSDCTGECNKSCSGSCSGLQRDCSGGCGSAAALCTSCNQGCQGFSAECNRDCMGCSKSCNQCSSDCNQCSSDCNQCNRDCSQCSSECASCGSQCNQCNSDCARCGNQCSVAQGGGGYPHFPTPPGPADPPPPLAKMLVGARGAVALVLPPLLFLWWRRRLHAGRRQSAEAAS